MGRTSDARERLVESARELFLSSGYTAVGVKDICAKAGVNKGSFYHFFPSKRDLALAVIDEYATYYHQMMDRAMLPEVGPAERIRRLFGLAHIAQRSMLDGGAGTRGCPVGNLALELSTRDEAVRRKLADLLDGWSGHLERGLEDTAGRAGRPRSDPGDMARSIVAYFEGVLLLAKTHNDPDMIKKMVPGALRLAGLENE